MTLNIRLGQAGEGGGGSAHPTAGKFRHRSSAGEKLTQVIHTRHGAGNDVWVTEAEIRHWGVI